MKLYVTKFASILKIVGIIHIPYIIIEYNYVNELYSALLNSYCAQKVSLHLQLLSDISKMRYIM